MMDTRMDKMEDHMNKMDTRMDAIQMRQNLTSNKLDDIELNIKVSERNIRKDIHKLDDETETVIEILKIRELLPN